jgi:hypothetical protein
MFWAARALHWQSQRVIHCETNTTASCASGSDHGCFPTKNQRLLGVLYITLFTSECPEKCSTVRGCLECRPARDAAHGHHGAVTVMFLSCTFVLKTAAHARASSEARVTSALSCLRARPPHTCRRQAPILDPRLLLSEPWPAVYRLRVPYHL